MLIFVFSIELGWLPASGYVPLSENWRASLASTIMPAFVLGNAIAAILMRHTRGAMLQVLESDYVRTARAKGLSERTVIFKHALRNALTPVITLGALELGTLLSGAVLTEQIFSIPGFGKLIVDAVFNRDYAVVQGVVLVTATIYIALNLIAEHAEFGAAFPDHRTVDGAVAGARHLSGGAVVQPGRRRPARRARPARTVDRRGFILRDGASRLLRMRSGWTLTARNAGQITISRLTRRQSISYSRSTTGGRAKCQVRPERAAPRRTISSAANGWKSCTV
jgi:hypothetical protein